MSEPYKKRLRGAQTARRDKEIKIRLTTSERDRVRAIAASAGLDTANLIRSRLLEAGMAVEPTRRHTVIAKAHGTKCETELTRQLARLGNNLNQIARAVNRHAVRGDRIDVIKLFAVMLAIERQLVLLYKPGRHLG